MWDETRPVRLHTVDVDSAGRATAVLQAGRLEAWRTLTVAVEAEAPHRIRDLGPYRRTAAPDGREATPTSPEELDAYTRRIAAAELFSGGVLAARGDEAVLRSAYGEASKEYGIPNRPDTRYILGSINKMFTAVAILQLVERGALSLEDTVGEHLPGVLPDTVAEAVTIRHLLTHTSGLQDFLFTPQMEARNRAGYRTVADYLPLLADDTLAFEPGTEWGYSNTGYLVLGALLQAVTGEDYYEYIRRTILEPTGMTATGWPELDRIPENVASTYERVFDRGRPGFVSDRYTQVVKGTPAGGGFSTLDDMHRGLLHGPPGDPYSGRGPGQSDRCQRRGDDPGPAAAPAVAAPASKTPGRRKRRSLRGGAVSRSIMVPPTSPRPGTKGKPLRACRNNPHGFPLRPDFAWVRGRVSYGLCRFTETR